MTSKISYGDAGRAVMKAGESLAALLALVEDMPLEFDDIELDLGPDDQPFDASCKLDRQRETGVIVTINPEAVRRIDALMDAAGLVTRKAPTVTAIDPAEDIEPFLEAAIQWLMLHEFAHWWLGHLGYIAAVERLPPHDVELCAVSNALSAVGRARPPVLTADHYLCFELQADFWAMQLLDTAFADVDLGETEPHARAASLDRSNAGDGPRIPWPRRFAAIAAGAVILIMEQIRHNAEHYDKELHPSPEARAIAIMTVVVGHSVRDLGYIRDGEIRIKVDEENDEFIDVFKALMKDAMSIFHTDLAHLAQVLGVEPIFSRDAPIVAEFLGEKLQVTETINDLFAHMMEPEAGEERFVTEGGRQLARLRALEKKLRTQLASFAMGA